MKYLFKLTYLVAIAFFITTLGCSNDDEDNSISTQDLTVNIDENPINGQVVGSVVATGNGTITFSIASQTPIGALSINSSTGELTVADVSLFDFEANPIITANVSVSNTVNTETIVATINLNNVNELSTQDFAVTIDENPTDGQVLGTIQAVGDGTLSFSITSQTPAGALNINANTGELTVADPNVFDFETNPVITADILIDNSGNTETLIATINLNDLDEVSAQNLTVAIDENPTDGQIVGAIQANGGNLTFAITFQNPAGALNINASTGELTVANAALFDFETNPNMLATVSVENSVNMVSVNATINLNNINELGDYNYGGIIFWLDPTDNSHGLVCALENQTSAQWGCSGVVTGASGTAIGTGAANTAAIVSAGCATGSAAEFVTNLNLNGYTDWFLPSLDEFSVFSTNYQTYVWPTVQANGGSAFYSSNWTSTEVSGNNAYIAFIGDPTTISIIKTVPNYSILPVRAF
jgi:hypothetical protein